MRVRRSAIARGEARGVVPSEAVGAGAEMHPGGEGEGEGDVGLGARAGGGGERLGVGLRREEGSARLKRWSW